MNKLIRLYNQNRRKFWTIIILIIFVFGIIKTLDYIAKVNNEKENKNSYLNNNTLNTIETTNKPNKSAISNTSVIESTYNRQNGLISNFVNYCNSKDLENAYNLISQDCKEELFPNIRDFKENYYDNIFKTKKQYNIQNWSGSIYIIRYTEDMLSTGKTNNNAAVQDFIKIISEEGEEKLSINGFFGKESINKEKEYKNINLKIISKKIYMDYEIYDIELKNNTGDTIILDPLTQNDTIYLTDSNKVRHYAINNEIVKDSIIAKNKYKINVSIKFDNPYISGRKINSITFSKIAKGYGNNGYGAYKDIINFNIEL